MQRRTFISSTSANTGYNHKTSVIQLFVVMTWRGRNYYRRAPRPCREKESRKTLQHATSPPLANTLSLEYKQQRAVQSFPTRHQTSSKLHASLQGASRASRRAVLELRPRATRVGISCARRRAKRLSRCRSDLDVVWNIGIDRT